MKKLLVTLLALFMLATVPTMKAQDFFDTADAPHFFTFGARVGFNTSNRTFPSGYHNMYNHNSWGTGFNVGVIANLNFKEYLSLQPGIFYESRSGDFSYATDYLTMFNGNETYYELGHWRGYYITVPVVGVVKFNLAENIKWMVEFGPYVQFSLKQKSPGHIVLYREPLNQGYGQFVADRHNVDFGLKMGSGLKFCNHYYIGFHYLAGLCNAWAQPSGGKNKSWEFSIGYDF